MINFTDNLNEQYKQLLDLQTRSLQPMRVFATVATEAAEKIARQNYAVAGDVIDFASRQANLSLSGDNLSDVASAQMESAQGFVELMNSRANEYSDMAQQFGGKVKEATDSVSASFK